MKAARFRIFHKNLLCLLAVAALFAAEKWIVVRNEVKTKQDLYQINECVEQCNNLEDTEKEAFIFSIGSGIEEKDPFYSAVKNTRNALYNSLQNLHHIQRLISFAQNKEGELDTSFPANYEKLLNFYAGLSEPELINEQPLDLYFALQTYNIVPIVVLLLNVAFWGRHYEEEMHKVTQTTYYGGQYDKSIRKILLLLGISIFMGNELIDLAFSGMLNTGHLWTASLQSYREMKYGQMDITIGTMLILLWCSKVLNVLFLSALAEHIAQKQKNIKDTAAFVILFIIALVLIGKALENSLYYSVMQVGYVNYQKVIAGAIILVPVGVSTAIVGLVILFFVVIAFWIYSAKRIKTRKR